MRGKRRERLSRLIEILESSPGKGRSVRELSLALGVGGRSILRDIKWLREMGAEIACSGGKVVLKRPASPAQKSSVMAMRRLAILSCIGDRGASMSMLHQHLCDPIRGFACDEHTLRRDLEYLERKGYVEGPDSTGGDYVLGQAFMPRFALSPEELSYVLRLVEVGSEAVANRFIRHSIREKLVCAVAPEARESMVNAIRLAERASRRRHLKGRSELSNPGVMDRADMLEHASLAQKVVRMGYEGKNGRDEGCRDVHPLGLVYNGYHDAWYLVAYCTKAQAIRHFRLDRMKSVALLDETFHYPEGFSLEDYMAPMWGIQSDPPVEVRVRFYDEMNVISRVRSETCGRRKAQLQKEPDGSYIYADEVAGVSEFRAWIRSFGSSAEVLLPCYLREQMIASAREVYRIYAGKVDSIERR